MIELPILACRPDTMPEQPYLLCPWTGETDPVSCDLVSLLPVINVNDAVLRALDAKRADAMATAALLMVDPFLRMRDCVETLSQAGVKRVANFPTVQLIDGETARSFESARVGAAREIEVLAALGQAGFETIGFAASLHAAQELLSTGARTLVLHPGFALADWRERAGAALSVARMIATLRSQTQIPLLVYRPHGFGTELDSALERADGIAFIARDRA